MLILEAVNYMQEERPDHQVLREQVLLEAEEYPRLLHRIETSKRRRKSIKTSLTPTSDTAGQKA